MTKECKRQKIIEINEAPIFSSRMISQGKEFLKEISEKQENAKEYRNSIIQNVNNQIDKIISALVSLKTDILGKFESHELNYQILQNELSFALENAILHENDPLGKNSVKALNKIEEICEKFKEPLQINEFSVKLGQNNEAMDSCMSIIGHLYDMEVKSPFQNMQKNELYGYLFNSCQRGDIKIVDYLINSMGLEINYRDSNGNTPFMEAILNNQKEVYKMLFEKYYANAEISDNAGKTALSFACLSNNTEMASYLITKCKVNPNQQNKWKDAPIHYAAEANNLQLIKLLVEDAKADLDLKNEKGKTAMEIATSDEIRRYLSEKHILLQTPKN